MKYVAVVGLKEGAKCFVPLNKKEGKDKMLEEAELEILPGGSEVAGESLWSSHALMRCQLAVSVPLYVNGSGSPDVQAEEISMKVKAALNNISKDICGDSLVFLAEGAPGQGGSAEKSTRLVENCQLAMLDNLLGGKDSIFHTCGDLSTAGEKFKSSSGCQLPLPITIKVFLRQSKGPSSASAPYLQYQPGREGVCERRLSVALDVLAAPLRTMELSGAIEGLLLPVLRDQIAALSRVAEGERGKADMKISAYHFCPPNFCHPVTVLYSLTYGETEESAVNVRKGLHQRLGLPMDRPLLRTVNSLSFTPSPSSGNPGQGGKRLKDVHVGLPPSGVSGGKMSLVEGSYEYFHYMQDRIDDSGWGCAYRSLQTISSWFLLQHYTSSPPPSHRKIQEILVEMGDKERSFLGSSQWIGAIELSYVLDQFMGVSCRVLSVQSGRDMPSKGPELALHFQTQGTPVMIGGGVLAYTLLGVDYNELTGDCAFLILDPHYTGGEDLKSIRNGGWVGWKAAVTETGQDFFVSDAFYNLLLPQRPATV